MLHLRHRPRSSLARSSLARSSLARSSLTRANLSGGRLLLRRPLHVGQLPAGTRGRPRLRDRHATWALPARLHPGLRHPARRPLELRQSRLRGALRARGESRPRRTARSRRTDGSGWRAGLAAHAGSCLGRPHRHGRQGLRATKGLRRDHASAAGNGLRIGHRGGRHHGRRATVGEVVVGDIGHVADIDAAFIGRAGAIGRAIRLPWAEWDPADRRAEAGADRHPRAEADKGDQRWGIDRMAIFAVIAARDPAPAWPELRPPAVMERRETPGCIVHPGPAPWQDVGPVAMAVGHPADLDRRIPHLTIFGVAVPCAGFGQRLTAGHVGDHGWRRVRPGRHRARRRRVRGHERIGDLRPDIALKSVRAGDAGGLVRPNGQRHAGAEHLRPAVKHRHRGRLRGIAGFHHIAAGLPQRNGAAWRTQGYRVALVHAVEREIHVALR